MHALHLWGGMDKKVVLWTAWSNKNIFFVTIAVEASLQKNGREIILDLAEAATRGQNGLIEKLFSSQ